MTFQVQHVASEMQYAIDVYVGQIVQACSGPIPIVPMCVILAMACVYRRCRTIFCPNSIKVNKVSHSEPEFETTFHGPFVNGLSRQQVTRSALHF